MVERPALARQLGVDLDEGAEAELMAGYPFAEFGPEPTAGSALFLGVPRRPPRFVGRADQLAALSTLAAPGAACVHVGDAVGAYAPGKTTLVAEHCHRRRADLDLVLWSSGRPEVLARDLVATGALLGLGVSGVDGRRDVDVVIRWFEHSDRPWLVVLDETHPGCDLDGLVPSGPTGCTIVVSREAGDPEIALEPLGQHDRVALLADGGSTPTAGLEELAGDFGGSPLALSLGRTLLRAADGDVDVCRQMLMASLPSAGALTVSDQDATGRVFAAVWAHLVATTPKAAEVLAVLAALAPSRLSAAVLAPDLLVAGPEDIGFDRQELLAALGVLDADGLVRSSATDFGCPVIEVATSVAELVEGVVPATVDAMARATRLVAQVFPAMVGEVHHRPRCQYLLPHALAVLDGVAATDDTTADRTAAWLADRVGTYLTAVGDVETARTLLERAVDARTRLVGADDPETFVSTRGLARALLASGDAPAARALQEQLVERVRRRMGEEHPMTIAAMEDLAAVLAAGGDSEGAESLRTG